MQQQDKSDYDFLTDEQWEKVTLLFQRDLCLDSHAGIDLNVRQGEEMTLGFALESDFFIWGGWQCDPQPPTIKLSELMFKIYGEPGLHGGDTDWDNLFLALLKTLKIVVGRARVPDWTSCEAERKSHEKATLLVRLIDAVMETSPPTGGN